MNRSFLLVFLLFACTAFAREKTKLAVMSLKANQGVSSQVTASLMDLISAEVSGLPRYTVVNQDDITTMLEHVANKQLMGCDDTKCLTIIGGALGVDHLLSGNIGKIGTRYVINMKVIDIDEADVLTRISVEHDGDETGLIERTRYTVRKLFDEKRLFRQKVYKWSMLGAAVGGAGLSGYFAFKGNDLYENDFKSAVGHDDAVRIQSDVKELDLYRNVSIAVTGVLTGTVIYLFRSLR